MPTQVSNLGFWGFYLAMRAISCQVGLDPRWSATASSPTPMHVSSITTCARVSKTAIASWGKDRQFSCTCIGVVLCRVPPQP